MDPFLDFAGTSIVEAGPRQAVARQKAATELENHAGVRHAGALFAVGYAASRALVVAALGPDAEAAELRVVESEVEFTKAASGGITATAEPVGDWESTISGLFGGGEGELRSSVQLRSEEGRIVTSMTVCWGVEMAPPAKSS